MSLSEQILEGVKTRLVTANVAGGRVYRSRRQALHTLPAIVVEPFIQRTKQEHTGGAEDSTLIVAVRTFVEGETPDSVADPIVRAIVAALKADPTLGIGADVQLQGDYEINWDFEDYDVARADMAFRVLYRETP